MKNFSNLRKFILKAGKLSLEKRNANHVQTFKGHDNKALFLVTEVDLAISRMFKEFVFENYGHLNYMIIDEETIASLEGCVFDKIRETEYQFVIDPIDGTVNYAAGMPLYGITVAVMKHGKLLEGYIYLPALNELVYTDGQEVFFETGQMKQHLPKDVKSDSRVLLGNSWFVYGMKPAEFIWQDYNYHLIGILNENAFLFPGLGYGIMCIIAAAILIGGGITAIIYSGQQTSANSKGTKHIA